MSKILSKDEIFGVSDLVSEPVEVPEWGGSVIIRTMTGTERDAYEAGLMTRDASGAYKVDTTNMRAKLVAHTAVNEAGDLIFDEGDIVALAGKNAAVIERLFVVAQRINGLGGGTVEAAAKNSAGGPVGASASDLPPLSG